MILMKKKTLAIIIMAILMISTATMMMKVNAQDEGVHGGSPNTPVTGGSLPTGVTADSTIMTIPYVSFAPNPIGLGQELLVNIWVQPATVVNRAHTGYTVLRCPF